MKKNHSVLMASVGVIVVVVVVWWLARDGKQSSGYYFSAGERGNFVYYNADKKRKPPFDIVTALPDVAIQTDALPIASDPPLFTLTRNESRSRTAPELRIDQKVFEFEGESVRAGVRAAYQDFLLRLESEGLSPEGVYAVKAAIASHLPMTFDEVLYYHFGFDQESGYVDLRPGMRIRVDYQVYQTPIRGTDARNGYVGSATSYYYIHAYRNARREDRAFALGFEPFLARNQRGIVEGGTVEEKRMAGGVTDLMMPARRQPYLRVLYPQALPPSHEDGKLNEGNNVTLIASSSLEQLAAATEDYVTSGEIDTKEVDVSLFFFRGRAVVLPQVGVMLGQSPQFVSVGTTVRDLVARFAIRPSTIRFPYYRVVRGSRDKSLLPHHAPVMFSDADEGFLDIPVVQGDIYSTYPVDDD